MTPFLTATEDGLWLSWLERVEDGHALRFSTWDGEGFGPPSTIHTSDHFFANWADFSSILSFGDGRLAAHWLEKAAGGTYEYDVFIALSEDGGKSWGKPERPHRDGTLNEHGFVSLVADDASGFSAVWLDGRGFKKGASDNEMTLRTTAPRASTARLSPRTYCSMGAYASAARPGWPAPSRASSSPIAIARTTTPRFGTLIMCARTPLVANGPSPSRFTTTAGRFPAVPSTVRRSPRPGTASRWRGSAPPRASPKFNCSSRRMAARASASPSESTMAARWAGWTSNGSARTSLSRGSNVAKTARGRSA